MPNPDGTLTPEEQEAARVAAGVPAPVEVPPLGTAAAVPVQDYRNIGTTVKQLEVAQKELAEARDGGGLYTPEERRVLAHQSYLDATGHGTSDDVKTTDPKTGKLVSTRPSWYSGSKPPTHQPAWQRGLSGGLGMLAQGAQKNADLSAGMAGRPLSLKERDQGKANAVGVLSGFGQAFLNKPQINEKQDLDTAVKQAQMYRTLNPARAGTGAGSAANALRTEIALGNLGMRGTIGAANIQNNAVKQQKTVDEDTADSPLSIEYATVAHKFGMIPEDQIGKISLRALRGNQRFLELENSHEFSKYMADYRASLHSMQHANDANAAQTVAVTKEDRARAQEQVNSQIAGVTWDGGPDFVPPPKTRQEVQDLVASHKTSLGAIHDIKEGIAALKQRHGDKFGEWYAGLVTALKTGVGLNFDKEDQPWISKINIARDQLGADQRIRNGMKAPQGIELTMMNELLNSNKSIGGILFPDEFYNGLADGVNKSTARGVKARNATFNPNGSDPPAANENLRKTYNVTPVEYGSGGEDRPGRRPFQVAPKPNLSGEQPPPAQEATGSQAAPQRPSPPPVQLPDVPVDTTGGLGARQPVPKIPAQQAPAAAAPQQKLPDAKGTHRYVVDYKDGTSPMEEDLTPEEARKLTELEADVRLKQ